MQLSTPAIGIVGNDIVAPWCRSSHCSVVENRFT